MQAKKCDRCGKFYLDDDRKMFKPLSIFKWNNGGEAWKMLDLCDDCRNELVDWWNAKNPEMSMEAEDEF